MSDASARTVPSLVRRALPKLALLVGATAFALGTSEMAYRTIARRTKKDMHADETWRTNISRLIATLYRASPDPQLVYEPVPGASVRMPYGVAAFNRGAMRDDREHSLTPLPGRTRVALVGDSLAWSEDVALEDSLGRQLEASLEPQYEVLNFGVTGYDTAQEAAYYARAAAYHPNIALVVFCLNDAFIMSGPYNRYARGDALRAKESQDAYFATAAPVRAETLDSLADAAESAAHFRLLTRLAWNVRRAWFDRSSDYLDEYTLVYRDASRVARVESALRSLHDAIVASGATPALVISPILRPWRRDHWQWIRALIAERARAAGFTVLDAHDPLVHADRAEALRLPGDSLHYGPHGQRVFARTIASWLRVAVQPGPGIQG